MAGILANSNTITMVDGDTAVDQTNTGYLGGEQITLSTTPTGASYLWALSPPSGSTAALDSTTVATPKFAPDISGYYTITCTVGGSTSYVLRVSVVQVGHLPVVSGVRLVPMTDAQAPTPATGRLLYYSSTQSKLATKDSAGTIRTIDETSL